MTKEEILAMEAGEELSRAVTETIFQECWHEAVGDIYDRHCSKCKSYDYKNKPYSSDISAAWLVLKKLREEYWCIEIRIADGCRVILELLRTPPIRVEVNAGTPFEKLPEAICKAALLAKLEVEK